MSNIPTAKLNSGYEFPLIGYGTFGGHNGHEEVYNATKTALQVGYRHFDTAFLYETEEALGKSIIESKVSREELFITTKLWNTFHEPQHVGPAMDLSLKNLKMDYVDLYLMHWPISWEFKGYEFSQIGGDSKDMKQTHVPVIDTWRAMEQLVKDGKARSIGVSNFTIPMLEDLLSKCEIPPAVNQVEIHPFLPQEELLAYCKQKNIVLTAYSPLGNPGYRDNVLKSTEHPVVLEIAKKYNKSAVQVLLNFGVNRGYAVIPKSVTPKYIESNFVYFKMDDSDIEALVALGRERPHRTCKPDDIWGPDNKIFDI